MLLLPPPLVLLPLLPKPANASKIIDN